MLGTVEEINERRSPMDFYTRTSVSKAYIYLLFASTGCRQKDLIRAMTDRDRWRLSFKGIRTVDDDTVQNH